MVQLGEIDAAQRVVVPVPLRAVGIHLLCDLPESVVTPLVPWSFEDPAASVHRPKNMFTVKVKKNPVKCLKMQERSSSRQTISQINECDYALIRLNYMAY